MEHTEQEYINIINKLKAEIADNEEIIELAYNKVKDLELRLSLNNSSFTKKALTEKQVQAYEDKIRELEDCLSTFNADALEVKADEIEVFLKKVLAIKNEFESIKKNPNKSRIKLDDFEKSIMTVSKDLASRLLDLLQAIVTVEKYDRKDNTEIYDEYINRINLSLGVIREFIQTKENEYLQIKKENQRLRIDIQSEYGTDKTKEELLKIIDDKDIEIESLKDKIKRLEFEAQSKAR